MFRRLILQMKISSAQRALAKRNGPGDENWTPDEIKNWLRALADIRRVVNGDRSTGGFSIIRSLDSSVGLDGAKSQALLDLAGSLRRAGIGNFQ